MNLILLLISLLLFVITKVSGQFECPAPDCDGDCDPADDDHCIAINNNEGTCDECEDGYWAMSDSHYCVSCVETLGCSTCRMEAGCTETCESGVWSDTTCTDSPSLTVTYCDGSTLIESDNDEEETTDDDDDDDDGDDETTDAEAPDDTVDCSESDCIDGEAAIAKFDSWGIEGFVKVIRGHINISLDLTDFDFDDIADLGGESCFTGGIYYGIYDAWEHDLDDENQLGETECGISNAGRRWDPWLACSTTSSNFYCDTYGTGSKNCVPASSWLSNPDDSEYVCSEINYKNNPFSCEVGDWSGKYGVLYYDSDTKMITGTGSSAWEVNGYDLSSKSVVFRCHDRSRVFCAGFESYTETEIEEDEIIRPVQNGTYSKIAYLDENKRSYVRLSYYGEYDISIDANDISIGGTCGDEIYYRIFTSYVDDTCSEADLGSFYDPTLSCDEQSDGAADDKDYCDDTERCGDGDYEYSCVFDGSDGWVNRFNCAPAGLHNKYGSIDISQSATGWVFNATGTDGLMVPLKLLDGASVVLQCDSNLAIVACGQFEDYTDDDYDLHNVYIPEDSDDSSKNKNKKNNSNDSSSGFLGMSDTVMWILLVLLAFTIIPCVKHYRDKKKSGISGDKGVGPAAGKVRGAREKADTMSAMDGPDDTIEGPTGTTYGGSTYGGGGNNHSRGQSAMSGTHQRGPSNMSYQSSRHGGGNHIASQSFAGSVVGGSVYGGSTYGGGNRQQYNQQQGPLQQPVGPPSEYGGNGGYNDNYSEYGGQGQQQGYGNDEYGNEYDQGYQDPNQQGNDQGGYYDENGNWVDEYGQYDEQYNGDEYDQGQYDENGQYNEQGYDENGQYDENGNYIDNGGYDEQYDENYDQQYDDQGGQNAQYNDAASSY